ncbi:hypothetical protein ACFUJU_13370 [Streptomyces sp. NPDC057235]|uniref:hypothetical protein n=1 Tax=Streptomyces sp. NPDC057235 TaxID=3346058 RepID=UPI0036452F7D
MRCSYCDQPILGKATPIADDAATGAHPPAYWHADRAECGKRARRPSLPDGPSPLQRYLARTARPRP